MLDGLDEVKADIGDKILAEVRDFTGKYFRNQFVITCRIAAQFANRRYSLSFTDVEVADFDEEQIEAFAEKWFVMVAVLVDQMSDHIPPPQSQKHDFITGVKVRSPYLKKFDMSKHIFRFNILPD